MFEIHTLRLGELTVPSGDGMIRDPIHAWYATDGKTRILIDSGMPDAAEVAARLKVAGREAATQRCARRSRPPARSPS